MLVANRRARTVMWDDRLTTRSDLPLATEALCRLLGSCGNEVHMSTSLGGGVVSRVELDRRRLRSFDPFWAFVVGRLCHFDCLLELNVKDECTILCFDL